MKKILIIFFLFINLSISATTFYVSPTGTNGTYPTRGTLANPWKTWGYAFNSTSVLAGDTVYFRGGIYYKNLTEDAAYLYGSTTGYMISRDGTVTDTLCYFAYPGETPILDCYNATTSANWNWGIYYGSINYVKLKGLHVRNVRQIRDQACFGAEVGGNGLVIENCKFYNIWGAGMRVSPGAGQSTYIINCDAYNCCDSLSSSLPGNDGYGFSVIDAIGNVYFEGCRAWNCGDDGFNSGILQVACNTQYTEYNNCWSFRNGMMQGGGTGFKMGWHSYTDGNLKRVYNNCVAAYNRWNGWKTNDYYTNTYAIYCHVYNCIAYHNGWQGGVEYVSAGFEIHNVPTDDANETLRILKNNISYDNEGGAVLLSSGAKYTHDHNNWDIPLTLTDADFISVDSTGITAARQADGSLPNNDCYKYFLRPSSTFQGYQQGVDVSLTYDAVDSLWRTPPSIGFKEYYPTTPAVDPVLADISTYQPVWVTSTTASTGGYVSDDGGGTVSARGVCWNTIGTPTTSDSKTTDGTGDGEFTSTMTGLTQGTTYYVRAYATNEAGTAYGSQMTFRTQIIKHSGKIIKHLGKFMIIN